MATPAEVQVELGVAVHSPRIIKSVELSATIRDQYVDGGTSAPGKARWCQTTIADSAADQAAAILVTLRG